MAEFLANPVVAEVAGGHGVPAVQVGQAALLGQMTTGLPVSPLTRATYLVVGLACIERGEYQRLTRPLLFAAFALMMLASAAFSRFGV
jgi:CitMHS family citrate-Mg2+:H+ or citrate-Ca2+:H+ symporter